MNFNKGRNRSNQGQLLAQQNISGRCNDRNKTRQLPHLAHLDESTRNILSFHDELLMHTNSSEKKLAAKKTCSSEERRRNAFGASKAAIAFSSSLSSLSTFDLEVQRSVETTTNKEIHHRSCPERLIRDHDAQVAVLDLKGSIPKEISVATLIPTLSTMRRSKSAPQETMQTHLRQKRYNQKRFHRAIIEVMPGTSMAYIGLSETLHALRQNRCSGTTCLQCDTILLCSDLATFILCSICESIFPILNKEANGLTAFTTCTTETEQLLGLGMTLDQTKT
jgi:hypothetical protein